MHGGTWTKNRENNPMQSRVEPGSRTCAAAGAGQPRTDAPRRAGLEAAGAKRIRMQLNHGLWHRMVPRKGLEPSRPLSHWHLKPARLPIPPTGPGPVDTDRTHAWQNASTLPKYYIQRGRVGVSRNGLIRCDLSTLTPEEMDPMASNQDSLVTVFGGSGFVGRNV